DAIVEPLFALVWDFFNRRIEDKELSDEDKDSFYASVQGRNFDMGERKMVPTLDVLITLCQQYNTFLDLRPETAENWKLRNLQLYDREIDEWGPKSDYKVKRREVITSTFDRLIELTHQWNSKLDMTEPMRIMVVAINHTDADGMKVDFESNFGRGQGIWKGES